MLRYSQDPNQLNIFESAARVVIPVTQTGDWKVLFKEFSSCLSELFSVVRYGDADSCKKIKKMLMRDVSEFILRNQVRSPLMSRLLKSMPNENKTVKCRILVSFAESVKFFIYKEKDLHRMANDPSIMKKDINAINYIENGKPVCPFRTASYYNDFDIRGTINSQRDNIKSFLISALDAEDEQYYESKSFYDSNCSNILDEVLLTLNQIAKDFENYQQGLYNPTMFEKGFFDSLNNINNNITKVLADMYLYKSGHARYDMFSMSESRSPISDNQTVMTLIHKLGYPKATCPAVLSNLFFPSGLRKYGFEPQPGQIEIDAEVYFDPAPGLGPAFKIRWVFNTDVNINNYLTPLANLIQKSDRKFDDFEAYNDQLTLLNNYMTLITDAYCIDATGYSDYLARMIYVYLMRLYGMPESTIHTVIELFSLGVKIGDECIPAHFGTYQGLKLVVFIMNHANRLMGIIADRIQRKYNESSVSNQSFCIRPNAGDDVTKATIDGSFSLQDILIETVVFAAFNCPTNLSKTAWMKKDGYFDFCSKTFARIEDTTVSISGVPAKLYCKQTVTIADFSEIFKVMDASNQPHRNSEECFDIMLPLIEDGLKEGCKLPNIYHMPMTLDSKIREARRIPYDIGGIADNKDYDIMRAIEVMKYHASLLLENYVFNPSGVFAIAYRIEGLEDTELFKALGSINRQPISDIVRLIRLLASTDAISAEELSWCKETLSRFERNIITATSMSRTSSTYHRIERAKDTDMLFQLKESDIDLGIPLPENGISTILLISILSNEEYVDIDNMRNYMYVMNTFRQYKGAIVPYTDAAGRCFYGVRDPSDGDIIRIYNNDDTRYPGYKPIWRCSSDSLRKAIQIMRDANASAVADIFFQMKYTTADQVIEDLTDNLLKGTMKEYKRNIVRGMARELAREYFS